MRNQAGRRRLSLEKKKKRKKKFLPLRRGSESEHNGRIIQFGTRVLFIVRVSRLPRPDGSTVQRQLFGPLGGFINGEWSAPGPSGVEACTRNELGIHGSGCYAARVRVPSRSEFLIAAGKVKIKCVRVDADPEQVSTCLFGSYFGAGLSPGGVPIVPFAPLIQIKCTFNCFKPPLD